MPPPPGLESGLGPRYVHQGRKGRISVIPSEEWDRHRLTIVGLYIRDKMSLPRLIKYMDEQYDFHAT